MELGKGKKRGGFYHHMAPHTAPKKKPAVSAASGFDHVMTEREKELLGESRSFYKDEESMERVGILCKYAAMFGNYEEIAEAFLSVTRDLVAYQGPGSECNGYVWESGKSLAAAQLSEELFKRIDKDIGFFIESAIRGRLPIAEVLSPERLKIAELGIKNRALLEQMKDIRDECGRAIRTLGAESDGKKKKRKPSGAVR